MSAVILFWGLSDMAKVQTINVQGVDVRYKRMDGKEYISLTDMAKKVSDEPRKIIENWLRSWSTLEYLALWETFYNPDFNRLQFQAVSDEVKKRTFLMSPQRWIEQMNAIGLISKAGRYDSGTFAHKDIAFKFASWLSVEFEFYIILEFQRLKEQEQKQLEWSAKRELAKINFHIHTDAIKENLIVPTLTASQKSFTYADETDMLNVVLFGKTAKQWREKNPKHDGNMRDYATVQQLLVLSNMESYNAIMINDKLPQDERMERLSQMAKQQLQVLAQVENRLYLPKG